MSCKPVCKLCDKFVISQSREFRYICYCICIRKTQYEYPDHRIYKENNQRNKCWQQKNKGRYCCIYLILSFP